VTAATRAAGTLAAAGDATRRLTDLDAAVRALAAHGTPEGASEAPGPSPAVTRAREVLRRAGERRALSAAHTVVALAGATGSGKSSVFNALAGEARVAVGARRPTTAAPVAGIVGDTEGAARLLDWLAVPQRHVLGAAPEALAGLVLLDLPDIDSVEVSHARTVDRLAQVVDVLVWVLDPQKYADNVLHQRYLRPMATHAAVTLVVLNQVDTLTPGERPAVLADLRRLLDADGLAAVPVLPTSAVTGEGLPELHDRLAAVVAARTAAEARLAADARGAALALLSEAGSPDPQGVGRREREALAAVRAEAAGVEVVADAVARSHRMAARAATGWPVTRWLGRLRADPLRRLGLARDVVDPALVRSSVPRPTAVLRARVDAAVRDLGRSAAAGSAEPWRTRVRSVAVAASPALADALDQAVVSTRLDTERTPGWWRLAGAAQWIALAAATTGLLWLATLAVLGYLRLPEAPVPTLGEVPWPSLLLVGGVLVGLLLALASALVARLGARRRAAKVRQRLREAVGRVAEDVVVAPVVAEVALCVAMNRAARRAAG
jgi:GTP-binding protein EngB required for normal cell division